ncbi:MAG: ribose 5-phosphate isomerase B [Bacteroidetes bacterium]|nr:ribose 5-phosphate isomerase B [Bacteroidota bacterium]
MIALGSDHAGFQYKEKIKELLISLHLEYKDYGTFSPDSTDYPDYASRVSNAILKGEAERGILICGTGIGMSIAANKFPGIRAAVCESIDSARLAREHNDANILCLGERITPWEKAIEIVKVFLTTEFENGERHCRRVNKLNTLPQALGDHT